MRSIASAVMVCAAVLTLACNRAAQNDDDNRSSEEPYINERSEVGTTGTADQSTGTGGGDTVSHGSDSDARHFAIQSGKKNAAEIELGKLAQQKATRADVRDYGAMLVRDHGKKLETLRQAVAPFGVELNTELPDDAEELTAKLEKLSGAEFDREFMKAMVDGHQDMKATIQGRLNDARRMTTSKSQLETAVDRWAQEALPGVEQHLMKAQQIHDGLGNRRNDTR